jgi:hypothetical protein
MHHGHGGRPNHRFHDCQIWTCGGELIWGRKVTCFDIAHDNMRQTRSHRTGRRGVSADYVDSQYHGEMTGGARD